MLGVRAVVLGPFVWSQIRLITGCFVRCYEFFESGVRRGLVGSGCAGRCVGAGVISWAGEYGR